MRRKSQNSEPPEGFRYQADVLSLDEELALVDRIRELPLKEFEFHGYFGKRRVIYFGWRYDFGESKLHQTEEIPAFLLPLRERAATFADLAAEDLPHVLITEYSPGAPLDGTEIEVSSTT